MVNSYLGEIDKQIREESNEVIRRMYLRCYTQREIVDKVRLPQQIIDDEIKSFTDLGSTSDFGKTANFQDDFKLPIYNLFSYGKATNHTEHYRYLTIIESGTTGYYFAVLLTFNISAALDCETGWLCKFADPNLEY